MIGALTLCAGLALGEPPKTLREALELSRRLRAQNPEAYPPRCGGGGHACAPETPCCVFANCEYQPEERLWRCIMIQRPWVKP